MPQNLHFDNALPWEDPDAPQLVVIDSSPSGHTMQRSGTNAAVYPSDDMFPSRFGPGYLSIYEDGGYTANSTDFNLNSGPWTIEGWINFPDIFIPEDFFSEQVVIQIVTAEAETSIQMRIAYNGSDLPYLTVDIYGDTFLFLNNGGGNLLPMNQWNHFAIVHESGSTDMFSLYLNGARIGQTAWPGFEFKNGQMFGMGGYVQPSGNIFGGFASALLDEIRIVNGKAIYTGDNYTVPTGPF